MELSYPLVRVPFESATKHFRLYHKHLTRELAQIMTQIQALDQPQHQPPPYQQSDHRLDMDALITKLNNLATTVQSLQQRATNNGLAQQHDLECCVKRTRYLQIQHETRTGENVTQDIQQTKDRSLLIDRLVADYLLTQGYLQSAKIMDDCHEERGTIGYLLDYNLYAEYHVVLQDLHCWHTEKAIAWCSQNGTRLRRLQSLLEFHLRLQNVVEYIRSRKPLEAVQYARTYLAPLAIRPDNQELRDAAMGEIQIAMATLAFESPEQCSIEAYERIFAPERWLMLEKMFRKAFNDVYRVHDPPSLCIALHVGLSTLNTRACHRIRDANAKARRSQSGSQRKKRCQKKEDGDDGGDGNEDSGNESDEVRLEPSTALQPKRDDSAATCSQEASRNKKRKHARTETSVPICPACTEVGSQLCAGLPFAYRSHSRLVCRVMQSVMDEHNPPLVLPNGRVYSKQGIELLTQRSSDGMIKCVDTHDIFAPSDVKPVYIL